ncbi:MAG: hypothetical protein Q8M15_10610 [Bacteroidota bacterium]|nr:hypothetical protein [Bacteroidota bacterium]
MENIYTGKSYFLKPGDIISVQTFDDPEGFSTRARYISFDGKNMLFDRPFNPFNKKKTIQTPLSHICAFYIHNKGAGTLKFVLITGGIGLIFESLVLAYEKDYYLFFDILLGVPLIKMGFDIPLWKRIYLPSYEIYKMQGK